MQNNRNQQTSLKNNINNKNKNDNNNKQKNFSIQWKLHWVDWAVAQNDSTKNSSDRIGHHSGLKLYEIVHILKTNLFPMSSGVSKWVSEWVSEWMNVVERASEASSLERANELAV